MKQHLLKILFLSFVLVFTQCSDKKDASEQLYNDVMLIHDEVMPKMSNIHRLGKKLKNIDNTNFTPEDNKNLKTYITQLENADEAMMSWMANFKMPEEGDEVATTVKYLEQEKIKIQNVSKAMLKSIDDANVFLNKHSPKQ